jgi:hypothetical protein
MKAMLVAAILASASPAHVHGVATDADGDVLAEFVYTPKQFDSLDACKDELARMPEYLQKANEELLAFLKERLPQMDTLTFVCKEDPAE